jgi:hypothetical protein
MNRNDFLNMMSETVPLNRQSIGEVYELIDIFPYFQSAHMLLLKGLKNNADVKFENQLRNSAIHIADREALYYMLSSPAAVRTEITEEKSPAVDLPSDTQQTVIESAKNSADLINEIENSSDDTKLNQNQDALNYSTVHSIIISSETDNEEPDGVMLLMDEESSPSEDNVIFMDPGFSVPENVDLLELCTDENDVSPVDETSDVPELIGKEEINSDKKQRDDLIDKFISANPRIEPNRDKSNLPDEVIHKPVVEEEGSFITETLARIYVNQAYYSKAIDIYEKLSLKFPEKSSYFASQIKKVKEYLKK